MTSKEYRRIGAAIIGGLARLWPMVAHAAAVVAKAAGTEVHADASKTSSVIATLGAGESIDAVERKGLYWQVKTKSGQTGFVSILKVKSEGGGGESSISQAIRAASEDGRQDGDHQIRNAHTRNIDCTTVRFGDDDQDRTPH